MSIIGELIKLKNNTKERVRVEDLMAKYPEGVSIYEVMKCRSQTGEDYYQYLFLEDKGATFTAGGAMADIIDDLIANIGSLDGVNQLLKDEGAEKFKYVKEKSKAGRMYTKPIHVGTVSWES